jgi:Lon protease-like protein
MVKQSAAETGFVITTHDAKHPNDISRFGAWVKIIDFPLLSNGLLGIDVQAQSLMTITDITIEQDDLAMGEATEQPHWPQQQHNEQTQALATALKQMFVVNPILKTFYPTPQFDDANWTCKRWLETLPINAPDKAYFYAPDSFELALNLICSVVFAKK